ncbi:MAG: damage-inducible protein CinA [Planctomyces sp.]|nr:damage-inducible protein CinA [Planctomyces sp.]
MTAEVIAIGSELTSGSKLDTNSQWLSRELESLGWTVSRHTSVADDMDAMVAEFRAAAQRSRVILVTGGLGPTLDDITRDALAAAFEQPLVMDEASLSAIRAIFAARGREMPERNQRQAERPLEAEVLPNHWGTAPGLFMKAGPNQAAIAVLPGVPAEMKPMFETHVRGRLAASGQIVMRIAIRTFGYGESDAERLLGDLTARGRNPEVGITASEAVISLWITARAGSESECRRLLLETRAIIHERLGESIYAEGNAEIEEVIARYLDREQYSAVLMEGATTGGLMAHWFTESAETSRCIQSAFVLPDHLLPESARPGVTDSAAEAGASQWPEEWARWAKTVAEVKRQSAERLAVLISSPFDQVVSDRGVIVRRGYVGVSFQNEFEVADVSMSGNLAIFRQRACRTAINRLRLMMNRHFPETANSVRLEFSTDFGQKSGR